MPAYRLPLELELHILELATPPLLMHHLAKRVKFLQTAALVHRSITPWAQQRLHDHFEFKYDPPDENLARLKERLSAARDHGGVPTRVHLDLTHWHDDNSGKLYLISDAFVSLGITIDRLWINPSHSSNGMTEIFTAVSHFILDDFAYNDEGPALRGESDGSDCAGLKSLTHFALYDSSLRDAPLFSPTLTHLAICHCVVSSSTWQELFARLPNLQTLIAACSLPRRSVYECLPLSVENLHRVERLVGDWTDAELHTHRLPSHLPRLGNYSFVVAVEVPSEAVRRADKMRLLRESLQAVAIPPGCRVECSFRMVDTSDVFDELLLEYGY